MIYFLLICTIVTASYIILISRYAFVWNRSGLKEIESIEAQEMVTVVIVARNEQENIKNAIQSVCMQKYARDKMELIVVNDNSTDNTHNEIIDCIRLHSDYNIKTINLDITKNEFSKKVGINKAISMSDSEIIIITDADCNHPVNWLKSTINEYNDENVVFVSGPVKFKEKKGFVSKLIFLEFASLIGSGAASILIGKPMMCNGANMSFRKSAFIKVEGYNGNEDIATGDDVFLMLKMKKLCNNGVRFLKAKDAIVETNPPSSIKEFFYQRVRWASKVKHYKEKYVFFNGLIILSINVLIAGLFINSLINLNSLYLLLIVLTIKLIVDSIFMFNVLKFFNRSSIIYYLIIEELFYPIYIFIVAVLSFKRTFYWKGRIIKS